METILNMVKQDVRGFRQQSKLLADVRLSSGGPSFLLQHINNASIEGFCIKPVTLSLQYLILGPKEGVMIKSLEVIAKARPTIVSFLTKLNNASLTEGVFPEA